MWPRELMGTEQEANVSALSMVQQNAIGDTESRLAVSLVVWWLWIPPNLWWSHRSPPNPRRLDRNKRCNVVYLTTWIFLKKVTLKDTKAKKKSQDKKVRMI